MYLKNGCHEIAFVSLCQIHADISKSPSSFNYNITLYPEPFTSWLKTGLMQKQQEKTKDLTRYYSIKFTQNLQITHTT